MNALDDFRIIPVYKDSQHDRLGSRFGQEVVGKVHHKFGVVSVARQHGHQIRVPDVGDPLVPDDTVSFLADEVVDELLHVGLCSL